MPRNRAHSKANIYCFNAACEVVLGMTVGAAFVYLGYLALALSGNL